MDVVAALPRGPERCWPTSTSSPTASTCAGTSGSTPEWSPRRYDEDANTWTVQIDGGAPWWPST